MFYKTDEGSEREEQKVGMDNKRKWQNLQTYCFNWGRILCSSKSFFIILGKGISPKGCWEVHQSEVPSAAMATKVRS